MLNVDGNDRDTFTNDLLSGWLLRARVPHLLIVDIRDFSKVKAAVGHVNCDAFMSLIFERLCNCSPDFVTMYRYAGDKFVAKFDVSCSQEEVLSVIESIKTMSAEPINLAGFCFSIGFWIGHRPSSHSVNVDDVIYDLEYRLKTKKSSTQANSSSLQAINESVVTPIFSSFNAKFHLASVHQVVSAVAAGEIKPHAQPIVDQHGVVVGYEVLARMERDGELIYPDRFIPIIKSRGLMLMFTKGLIENVLKEIKSTPAVVPAETQSVLSFNIDFDTLCNPLFIGFISQACSAFVTNGYQLKLEISEDSIVDSPTLTKNAFDLYRELGVELSVDDFGAAYSNFHRVNQLSFSEIKVDKSFVLSCLVDSASLLFINYSKSLADTKGILCVVEGVENSEQFDLLKSIGIKRFQGYLFSKPKPLHEALAITRMNIAKDVGILLDAFK